MVAKKPMIPAVSSSTCSLLLAKRASRATKIFAAFLPASLKHWKPTLKVYKVYSKVYEQGRKDPGTNDRISTKRIKLFSTSKSLGNGKVLGTPYLFNKEQTKITIFA